MDFDQIIQGLRLPYKRIHGQTIAPNGCMCALGALLLSAGFSPIPSQHLKGQYIPNTWQKDGARFVVATFSTASRLLNIPSSLARVIENFSDIDRMPGWLIADKLEDEKMFWQSVVDTHLEDNREYG